MATLKLPDIPDDLLKRLEVAASAQRRDVAAEVVGRLESTFSPGQQSSPRRSDAELSELAQHIRSNTPGAWMTPEYIRMAREWGRE